jgi:NAD(P)-dependent dehydrogenase (short-subunit alcohol dehydrogenase family)
LTLTGIGRIAAHALAENGASKVYIVGRREEPLKDAAAAYPGIIIPLVGDVTSQSSLQSVADTVRQQTGHINLLLANAGIAGPGLKGLGPRATLSEFVKSAWSALPADFSAVYDLNCTALYYTSLAFLELLDEGNKKRLESASALSPSQVIATGSMAGFMRDPRWGMAYCSSKAAVVSLMKGFATICVPWGVRFNVIAPGRTYSPFWPRLRQLRSFDL